MSNEMENRMEEQLRVDAVIDEINIKEKKLSSQITGLKENVVELRKNFWEDITVNIDEPDDIIETQESIKQQAALLSEKERYHGKIGEELKTLDKLKSSPYFGRIDFIEESELERDQIYIGISSLMDQGEEDFLIYDWRAPISSLYYDFSPGKAHYETIEGPINGEITLKRQFIIRQGKIQGMFDTGVTIGDHLLQQALGNNASTTMKSIVATIQKEQNKIIRNEKSNLLIVQGVAGSGKTSAALQRIAYLLYRYRGELNADNVVLFSPNPLFSSYIANVLPELGESNVKQITFLDFLKVGIGRKLAVESPFEQMEYVLAEMKENHYVTRMNSMDYKSSLNFKQMIDQFISYLNDEAIQFRNITFRGSMLISKGKISDYFYSLDKEISIANKMELVSKWLLKELRQIQRSEKDKDWVIEEAELFNKEDYVKAYQQNEDQNAEDEEEILRREVVRRAFATMKRRIKRMEFVHILATYKKLFAEWNPPVAPEGWEEISEQTATNLSRQFLTWEDATPYLYFKEKLLGNVHDRSVRQLIIDEAQDYSAFQFAYIKEIFPYTRMTLLGDINQAIYSHISKDNPLVPDSGQGSMERITLTKSYRSTRQIVEFTKYFAPGGNLIEPFNRDGSKPLLTKISEQVDLGEKLKININEFKEKGYETIAVICKTLKESEEIVNILQDKMRVIQITEETYAFEKGVLVLPVYLAKGIEFDAVIIPDASEERYSQESDRTLFYTACTRAMHELSILSLNEPCRFIKAVPKDKYDVAK
ncbi:AAA family ATPase [Oceanobacillus sp. 143]|uniref:Helicase n=1 Tax=Oceanobacillus zhaokaii TaxID=2052660 RepID=A0A345PCX8_9BACI|nr:RNA polymerase recycling motor HelD [Oceanobacillus zhaokaii]AXI07858.1 helicase [Oceanobacillus zhaokaii]QGS67949.1 AAA family ATPase [Oceanobacillus sp. 143]